MAKSAAPKSRKKGAGKKSARKKTATRRVRAPSSTPSVARLFQVWWDTFIRGADTGPRMACCETLGGISLDLDRIGKDFGSILQASFPEATGTQVELLSGFAPGPLELFRLVLYLFLRCPGPAAFTHRPFEGDPPPDVKFDARFHGGPDTLEVSLPATGPAKVTFLKQSGR